MNIEHAVALVTGANRGIGREIVIALLNAGVRKVYAGARNIATHERLRALDATRVVPVRLDVTNAGMIAEVSQTARDVTLLINNAGVLEFGSFLETPHTHIERQFTTNLYGTLNMVRAFAPIITARGGGTILNVLSVAALTNVPWIATYSATKAAAWLMTQSLRYELSAQGIRVLAAFPSAAETDMLAAIDLVKTPADVIAGAIVSGIAADQEDIFPDAIAAEIYAAWRKDHKTVERQFGAGPGLAQ